MGKPFSFYLRKSTDTVVPISEHTMNAHEVIKHLKAGNAHYSEKYEEYSAKYPVARLV